MVVPSVPEQGRFWDNEDAEEEDDEHANGGVGVSTVDIDGDETIGKELAKARGVRAKAKARRHGTTGNRGKA